MKPARSVQLSLFLVFSAAFTLDAAAADSCGRVTLASAGSGWD